MSLVSVDDALARLLQAARPLGPVVSLPLERAAGAWLAEPVRAAVHVPPHDNAAVDGIALRHRDLGSDSGAAADSPPALTLTMRVTAGDPPGILPPGGAARIFTGAPVPAGADTVIMQEDCVFADGVVTPPAAASVSPGQNIRPAGQDAAAGDTVLAAGERLTPMALGLAASVGAATLPVRRPRAVILSSGDELQPPGEAPLPGKIYNSNGPLLRALLTESGLAEVEALWLPDDRAATDRALRTLLDDARRPDVIISSGGVSVGEEDHLRAALDDHGRLDFWRLAIKPGKPFTFGELDGVPFFGLPGNPSAVLVCYLMLVMPWLRRCLGAPAVLPAPIKVPAGFAMPRANKRREYLRVRRVVEDGGEWLEQHPNQSSGMLSSAVWADGLAVVPEGRGLDRGEPLDYYPFTALLHS